MDLGYPHSGYASVAAASVSTGSPLNARGPRVPAGRAGRPRSTRPAAGCRRSPSLPAPFALFEEVVGLDAVVGAPSEELVDLLELVGVGGVAGGHDVAEPVLLA